MHKLSLHLIQIKRVKTKKNETRRVNIWKLYNEPLSIVTSSCSSGQSLESLWKWKTGQLKTGPGAGVI